MERLKQERAIAIGASLNHSSTKTYNSHVQSYLTFCKLHQLAIEPTADTLSFYTVYMAHHIKPESVNAYLSGICSSLEPFYPSVREIRKGHLVTRTLAGMRKIRGGGTRRKDPLSDTHLRQLVIEFGSPDASHDDKLFLAIVFIGFHALMRLGELTWPQDRELQSWRKVTRRDTVQFPSANHVSFHLPYHKADRLFEGNTIMVEARMDDLDPLAVFQTYLHSRDHLHGERPALWLRQDGTIPLYPWVRGRLSELFGLAIAGHSLRSGGATRLAELGVPDDRIQAMGRWASDAFRIYIRKNPVLLQALVAGRAQ